MNKLDSIFPEAVLQSIQTAYKNLLPFCIEQANIQPQTISPENLVYLVEQMTEQLADYFSNFQRHMQGMEETLRKHVKNQIELKLYYEHLEQTIGQMKNEQKNSKIIIESLKTENQKLREKQKTTSINLHSKNQEEHIQINTTNYETKLDTITKIKNRLSLNDTGDFYARNFIHKMEKDPHAKELHSKRESLASTLQKLYENQSLKEEEKPKSKNNSKSKTKKSKNKKVKSKRNSLQKVKKESSKNSIKSCLTSRRNSQV